MNKDHLCFQVAERTKLPVETVEAVLDSLEDVIIETLERGDQLHWGSFFRAWTVRKRPTAAAGKPIHPDTIDSKIRYFMPCCAFGSKVVQPMKKAQCNIAKKRRSTSITYPPSAMSDNGMGTENELAVNASIRSETL